MSSPTDGRANPWLDLVRSIAILLVLFRHGERALSAENGAAQGFWQTVAMNGWVGVDLFFVLSGYLIARHLLRAGIGSENFRPWRYLAMRALRILPAYYAVLLLIALGVFPFYQFPHDALGFRIAYHLLFLQDYLPSNINVVFWSLGVEEKFYLLAPVLVLALISIRGRALWIVLILMMLVLPLSIRTAGVLAGGSEMGYFEYWRVFRSPFHMALEGLLTGVSIAVVENAGLFRRSRTTGLFIFLAAGAVFTVWLGTHDFMAEIGIGDILVQPFLVAGLAGAMVLGAVILEGSPLPFTAVFRTIARLSYCLYLIHYPLIPTAKLVGSTYGPAAFWCLYLLASFGAALVLHLAVERPFLIWKDRIAQRGQRSIEIPLPQVRA